MVWLVRHQRPLLMATLAELLESGDEAAVEGISSTSLSQGSSSISSMSMQDRIAWLRFKAEQAAGTSSNLGVRQFKIKSPGATG